MKLISKLLLSSTGLIVALTLCEVFLRVFLPQGTGPIQFEFHPDLGPIPVRNQSGTRSLPGMYSYKYTNNQDGFRIVPQIANASFDQQNILFLGDSFTYGVGVDDDMTFSALVQQNLPYLRIINGGNGGKGTDYSLRLFQLYSGSMSPGITALFFFRNDFCDNRRQDYFQVTESEHLRIKPQQQKMTQQRGILGSIPGYSWLLSWSHLANLINQRAIFLLHNRGAIKKSVFRVDGLVPNSSCVDKYSLRLTEIYLRELVSTIQRSKSKFLGFYIPQESEIFLNKSSSEESAFLKISQELGFQGISLRQILSQAQKTEPDLYLKEGHWSETGHRIAAREITAVIKSMSIK